MDLKKVKELLEKVGSDARAALPKEIQEVLGHLDGIVGDWTKKSQEYASTVKNLEAAQARVKDLEEGVKYQNGLLDSWEAYYKALPEGLRDKPEELNRVVARASRRSTQAASDDLEEDEVPIWQRKEFQEHLNKSLTDAFGRHLEPKFKTIEESTTKNIAGLGQYIVGLMRVMKTDPEADFDTILKVTQEKGISDPMAAYQHAYADKLLDREVEKRLAARLEEERKKAPPVEGFAPGAPPEFRVFKPDKAPRTWEEAEASALQFDASKFLAEKEGSAA
jgi:hypothetical protein